MKKKILVLLTVLICLMAVQGVSAKGAELTRGEFCKKIYDVLNINYYPTSNSFGDLYGYESCFKAALWMNDNWYMRGYEDGNFYPDGPITKAEAAAVLLRILKEDDCQPDIATPSGQWYDNYVWLTCELGLMKTRDNWDDLVCEEDIDYQKLIAYYYNQNLQVLIDGEFLNSTYGQPYWQYDGHTYDWCMVEMYSFFQKLGASVDWDAATKTAIVRKGDKILVMQVGNNIMFVDSNPVSLSVPPLINNGIVYVPVEQIAWEFDAYIWWYPDICVLTINFPDDRGYDRINGVTAYQNVIGTDVYIDVDMKYAAMDPKSVFFALYNSENKMIKCYKIDTIAGDWYCGVRTVYDDELSYAKVFVWDSLGNLKPSSELIRLEFR